MRSGRSAALGTFLLRPLRTRPEPGVALRPRARRACASSARGRARPDRAASPSGSARPPRRAARRSAPRARRGTPPGRPSVRSPPSAAELRARRRRDARCAVAGRPEVGERRAAAGPKSRDRRDRAAQSSTSMSGGGVGIQTSPVGGTRTPPTSPTKASPGPRQIGDVVGGVAGRVDDPQAVDPLAAGERRHVLLRAPEGPRPRAGPCRLRRAAPRSSAAATGSIRCGRADLVDVDAQVGEAADQRAGRPGVVEVDVGQEERLAARRRRAPRAPSRSSWPGPGRSAHRPAPRRR